MREYRRRGAPIPNPPTGWPVGRFCLEYPDAPEYRQAMWGNLWLLGEDWFWQQNAPTDTDYLVAAQVWRDILSLNRDRWEAGEQCDITDLCLSYPNTASFIQYFPNDPRYPDDTIPEGYNQPPWYFATAAANLAYGTQTGDIITSLDRFPPGSLPTIIPASGLPRIRINVAGAGRITVNLRTMFAGSKIQITRDDDPLTAYFVDVLRDVASLPPTTVTEIAVDIDFPTPGEHHADLIVVSTINDQVPFLFHGAGLVSVDLCGLMPTQEETPMMGAVRLNDCQLEQFNTSTDTWEPIALAKFLPLNLSCQLEGHNLLLRPETNQPGLILVAEANKVGQNYLQINNADGEIFSVTHPGAMQVVNRQGLNSAANLVQRFSMRHNNALNSFGSIISWEASTAANGPVRGIADLATSWFLATDNVRVGRQRYFMSGIGGQAVLMEFRRGATSQIGFFGATPVNQPVVGGLTVDSALASTIAALTGLGLITSTVALPSSAPIVAIRGVGCGLEYSIDGELWGAVPDAAFLPLIVADDCNGVSLQDIQLDIQRVGGSTESINTMLSLSAVGEAGLATLPMSVDFAAQTSDQLRPVASIQTGIIDANDVSYKSRIALTVTDATQTRTIIEGQAFNTQARLGVLGALPVGRQTVIYEDLTDRQLALEIGQALHNFGFLNFIPCAPMFGEWALEWRNIMLTSWPEINCAVYADNGLQTTAGCFDLDSGFSADLNWLQNNNSSLVYAEMDVQWAGVPALTGCRIDLIADPGIAGSELLINEFKFTNSGEDTLTWSGDEDFGNIGIGALIQAAGSGTVTVTRVRLEGYGERPPNEGGLICG